MSKIMVWIHIHNLCQDEMGSSEEEESGMESGVDTYSRSSSRRGEVREEAREFPAELEEGERQGLESRYVVECLCCIHATCAGSPPRSQRLQG